MKTPDLLRPRTRLVPCFDVGSQKGLYRSLPILSCFSPGSKMLQAFGHASLVDSHTVSSEISTLHIETCIITIRISHSWVSVRGIVPSHQRPLCVFVSPIRKSCPSLLWPSAISVRLRVSFKWSLYRFPKDVRSEVVRKQNCQQLSPQLPNSSFAFFEQRDLS